MGRAAKYLTLKERKAAAVVRAREHIRNNRAKHNANRRRSYHKHKDRINKLNRIHRKSKRYFKKVLIELLRTRTRFE